MPPIADDAGGSAMVQAAWRAVAAYHRGQPSAHDVVRVIYFSPADAEPLPRYAERLDAILRDVSAFYRDGLKRFGVENDGLPLELKDGHVVVHLVRGRKPAAEYHYESYDETAAEVREAVKATMDSEKEHLVVLYGLSRKETDGRYSSDSPYCGGGSHRNGMAHAADFELLDPCFLRETLRTVTHNEGDDPRAVQTLAEFNSWYIGGIAHELGHALGLPHDFGHPTERAFGFSLMGTGNCQYRQEVWGGGKPGFISRVSALQLLAQPMFTHSDRGRWDHVDLEYQSLECTAEAGILEIRGQMRASVPAYAIVAYVWPAAGDEHYAQSYPSLLNGGEFALQIGPLQAQTYALRLASLHANGAIAWEQYEVNSNRAGNADARDLNGKFTVARAELAIVKSAKNARALVSDETMARIQSTDARRKLRVLREVLDPPAVLALRTCTEKRVFLSDVSWRQGEVGWGEPARNHYWIDPKNPASPLLKLNGEFFAKGIYAHAPSRFIYDLDGKWQRLTARVGIQDGAYAEQASAIFTVRGDGRELYRSARLRVGRREDVKVDLTNVKVLELVTDSGWEHNYNSWAIWAEPLLER